MSDVSLGLVHEAEVTLRKCGAGREFWVTIVKNPDVARKIVELVNIMSSFDVVVDYTRSLSNMIKAGNYDWVDGDIDADHFPVKGEGKYRVSVILFHFNRCMKSNNVIAAMDEQGFRAARIEELLALGAEHPDLQREFPIVAFGSVWWDPDGHRHVPSAWSSAGRRYYLGLHWLENDWNSDCRFAAVRK